MPSLSSQHVLSCSTISSWLNPRLTYRALWPRSGTVTTRKVPESFLASWDKPRNYNLGEASVQGHYLSALPHAHVMEVDQFTCPLLPSLPSVSPVWCFITLHLPDTPSASGSQVFSWGFPRTLPLPVMQSQHGLFASQTFDIFRLLVLPSPSFIPIVLAVLP